MAGPHFSHLCSSSHQWELYRWGVYLHLLAFGNVPSKYQGLEGGSAGNRWAEAHLCILRWHCLLHCCAFQRRQGSHMAAQPMSCLCQCGARLYWHVYVEGKARQVFQMCFLTSFLPQTHTMHVYNNHLSVWGFSVDHTHYHNKPAISMSYLILVVRSFCCLLWGLHLAECFVIDSQISAKSHTQFAKARPFSALFVL